MIKISCFVALAFFITNGVVAQSVNIPWGLIAAAEELKAQERRRNIYIGLGIVALIGAGYYLRWRNINLKDCPFCKEKVKKDAIVCKHCGKELID